jgi:hypothetical protein
VEDEPYRTWPPHPDGQVESLFRQANRDDFVIVLLNGVYELASPDNEHTFQFQSYIVPNATVWQLIVRQLERWLERHR